MFPGGSPRWRVWLRRLGPWLITGGILAFLLVRYPLEEIRTHMAEGETLPLVPFAALATLASLLLIASADWLVFRASLGRARWWGVTKGKAATSVLAALGYGFGHGGYGLWLARATGAGVRATVGMIGYVMLSDLAALCAIAGLAVALGGDFLGAERKLAFASLAGGLGGALVLAALGGPRLFRRLAETDSAAGRRARALLGPWMAVGPATYAASLGARGLNLGIGILATYGAARAFGLPLPLGAFVTYLPLLFLIGALPINVAGFGAVQAAWVVLFEPWAPGAQILAFQFVFHLMVVLGLLLRGLPFLRPVLREIEIGAQITGQRR